MSKAEKKKPTGNCFKKLKKTTNFSKDREKTANIVKKLRKNAKFVKVAQRKKISAVKWIPHPLSENLLRISEFFFFLELPLGELQGNQW